ncbi:MAG TPA: hypothetical protein VKB27_12705, partial [Gammaproteobacteria bacterium]|nr:hypothetical protein [Gammaproteobacteria bacterium]
MSFNYREIRARQQASETQWASYSDLFMVLAFIFLLMYMVSSLRTGMISVTSHAEIQEVRKELEIYETIKNQYLTELTNAQEKKIYQEIIDQIALLEDEASAKKKQLAQQSKEQSERESALNQYQQMIVAMMNANTVAKAEATREITTQKQENQELQQTITERSADLEGMQQQLQQKEANFAAMQQRHAIEVQQREQKFESLKQSYEQDQTRLAQLEQQIRSEAEEKEALRKAHAAEA